MKPVVFADLVGQTLESVLGAIVDNDVILFKTTSGRLFKMYHSQDCCESIRINDITGDIPDLIGVSILTAEETSSHDEVTDFESSTWTFYRIGTIKGSVVIRWLGESNGCYSESVEFEEVTE